MSSKQQRRPARLIPLRPPLTPAACDTPLPAPVERSEPDHSTPTSEQNATDEIKRLRVALATAEGQIRWFRNILAQERKSHGLATKVLTRHIEQQEQLIDGMRETIRIMGSPLTPTELGRKAKRGF